MNEKQKAFKNLVIKWIQGSLNKQNQIFYKKENIYLFKEVQKQARY